MTIAVPKSAQQPNLFILDRPKYDHVNEQTRFFREKARASARGQDVLFHGTRHRESVLASGILKFSSGGQTLSFTRSPDVAAYWAALPRDDDEGAGAVLVFDRASLRARYKLECIDDSWEADPSKFNEFWRAAAHDEFEEQVCSRNVEIAPHLIGLIRRRSSPGRPRAAPSNEQWNCKTRETRRSAFAERGGKHAPTVKLRKPRRKPSSSRGHIRVFLSCGGPSFDSRILARHRARSWRARPPFRCHHGMGFTARSSRFSDRQCPVDRCRA